MGGSTTEMSCLTVLEAESLRARCQELFFLRAVREGSIPCLVDGCLLIFPLYISLCLKLPFSKDTSQIGKRPTLITSFWFSHPCKDPISKKSHSQVLGVRIITYEFGWSTSQLNSLLHIPTMQWKLELFLPSILSSLEENALFFLISFCLGENAYLQREYI